MPLVSTFQLSKKKGNEHWIKPVVNRESNTFSWVVQTDNDGVPKPTVDRHGAYCFACGTAVKLSYVREQAKLGKMGEIMTAIIAEGHKKLYFSPTEVDIQVALDAKPTWQLRGKLPNQAMNLRVQGYGITDWYELYTDRQLTALKTFSDLLSETHNYIIQDGAEGKYAETFCTYLALAIGRTAETCCKATWWEKTATFIAPTFARQALQMTWVFAEANPFSTSTQNWIAQVEWIAKVIENLPSSTNAGEVHQADATTTLHAIDAPVIVTDPPYYDNIGYADLSDFFYVWLRPILRDTYPELFSGMATPKADEMVANRLRFENHNVHFEKLLSKALLHIRQHCSDKFPSTIFYAYKQQEAKRDGITSTGWETMLTAVMSAGFQIVGTWPMRTERTTGIFIGENALASSIVLVCRPRSEDAPAITRNDFIQELKKEMPIALEKLTRITNIRPVDVAQAAIGPGMEIYSRYNKVMRVNGETVPIREVLMHINKEIDDYNEKETGELDPESQFCYTWLQQHGYTEGNFGDADVLSKAKDVNIAAMHNKVLLSQRGKVRLLKAEEYAERENSEDMTTWEGCLRMVWHLSGVENSDGISGCAAVARAMRDFESAKRLARVLYDYYDKRSDAQSASNYNNLVTEWQYISESMGSPQQIRTLFENL